MSIYHHDFYTWTHEQAALLKEGRLDELDIEHLIEELEDMGTSRERELENRLGILLAHLLKWQYQPERCSRGWEATIKEQRRRIERVLRKNPGLKSYLDETFENAYGDARLIAVRETGLEENTFPEDCPFMNDLGKLRRIALWFVLTISVPSFCACLARRQFFK
jgi:uncharacterized protein DUF29